MKLNGVKARFPKQCLNEKDDWLLRRALAVFPERDGCLVKPKPLGQFFLGQAQCGPRCFDIHHHALSMTYSYTRVNDYLVDYLGSLSP